MFASWKVREKVSICNKVSCCQVIWGGRDESQYFDDLWAFDIHTGVWEEWGQDSPVKPSARNHLGGFVSDGLLYIYGAFRPPLPFSCFEPRTVNSITVV